MTTPLLQQALEALEDIHKDSGIYAKLSFSRRFDLVRAITAIQAHLSTSQAEQVPQFDHAALYRAMELASLFAGSVSMSDVPGSRGWSNDLRAHLSKFIVTKERT